MRNSASPEKAEDYLDLRHWSVTSPTAVALAAPDQEPLTYSALWDHITGTRQVLNAAGLGPGDVAVLAVSNGPAFVTATLAITLQAACAPIDLNLTKDECQFFLTRLNASTLVYEEGIDSPVLDVARRQGMRLIRMCCPGNAPAGVFSLGEIEGQQERRPFRQTDVALLFHTSATTDLLKLVPRSRASARVAANQDARALQLSGTDRYLSVMPLWYAHGLSAVLCQLSCGGAVMCTPIFQADTFVAALEQFRPTWFSVSPPLQRIILTLARDSPETFQRIPLRFVRSAGAAPATDVILMQEKLFGVPVLDGYGMTEAPSITRNTLAQRKPGSVGRTTGAEVAIMDESGQLLPTGMEGEIVLRGATVMSGYLENSHANQAAFHDGWFRTGDIGRLDDEGFLFIVGRHKEMINRGGSKFLPQEVDTVVAAHPAVAEVASFGVPHRTLGEEVAASVVLRAGAEVSELELRRFAAERLARHKVPRRVVFAERIPYTPTGKPKRSVLAEEFRALFERSSAQCTRPAEVALTSVEHQIVAVWRRILGIERVDATDDFFDLGGDSLSAALMLSEVEKIAQATVRQVELSNFFIEPTVAWLAGVLANRANQTASQQHTRGRILFRRNEGSRNPFFCFSHSELSPHQFQHVYPWLDPERPFVIVCPTATMQDGRLLKIEEIARNSVASIRAVRARGPYLLGGYCFGGVVAFEVARQLVEEGSEIALLALFDTPTPGYPKVLRESRRYLDQSRRILFELMRGKAAFSISDLVAHLRMLTRIAKRKFGILPMHSLPMPAPDLNEADLSASANSTVRRAYAPRVLSAPIIHFLGTDVPVSTQVLSDPRLGWQDFAGRGFVARFVPGDHVSLFSQANAPSLATELEKALDDAEAFFGKTALSLGRECTVATAAAAAE